MVVAVIRCDEKGFAFATTHYLNKTTKEKTINENHKLELICIVKRHKNLKLTQ